MRAFLILITFFELKVIGNEPATESQPDLKRTRLMIKRSLFVIGCLLGASAYAAAGAMELSICPAMTFNHKGGEEELFRAYEDLFVERLDEWQFVSANIAQFKFYITPLGRLLRSNPELLERMVKTMSAMDIGIGIEVGIRHGHERLIKGVLDPITEMGGRVDYLVTDNVFVKSQFSKTEDYTWESYEEAVEAYATFVAGIKAKYPDIKIGMIEAAFRFHWEDPGKFPAQEGRKKSYGDLKQLLDDVIAACERKGTRLDMLQPEYSYSRIEATPNGWEKLKAMEAFCYDRDMDFIFLFNDHDGGNVSDELFHSNVIHCLNEVQKKGLNPSMGTLQSWYEHPKEELPESKPYTFMHLAKEFAEINNNGQWSGHTGGRVVELFDMQNRSLKCEIISVNRDSADIRRVDGGQTLNLPFSLLSAKSLTRLKAWAAEREAEKASMVELVDKNNRSLQGVILMVGDDYVQIKHGTSGKIWKIPFSTLSDNSVAELKALQ